MNVRIIVPFTRVHPRTREALEPHGNRVEYHDVSAFGAYWELFTSLWRAGDDFILIEHDIEVLDNTISQFDTCSEQWCTFSYEWSWRPGYPYPPKGTARLWKGIGCVRFRSSIMAQVPILGDERAIMADHPGLGEPPWPHEWVDGLQGRLLAAQRLEPHLHGEVIHHQCLDAAEREPTDEERQTGLCVMNWL